MKRWFLPERVYYRPAGPRPLELLALAVLGLVALTLLERYGGKTSGERRRAALAAATQAERAFEVIRAEREARHIPLLRQFDPASTGLIFGERTPISTSTGSLSAKQTSANPNFAALLVGFFDELKLVPGDHLAVGYTGSFPALNIALLAASAERRLELTIIASAASSDYGASDPRFTWLDMERLLRERGVFPYRSGAASLGGLEDRGIGLSPEAKATLNAAIERSGALPLAATTYEGSLRERLSFLEAAAATRPYRAYVNIGGGAVSLGRSRSNSSLGPGIHQPAGDAGEDSVAAYFLSRGVPVVNLGQVVELAKHYGLPVRPKTRQRPGQGRIFHSGPPHPIVSAATLVAFLLTLYWIGARARRRAPHGPVPQDVLVDTAPSRHARPPSLGPLSVSPVTPVGQSAQEEPTLPSLRPEAPGSRPKRGS